MRTQRENTVYMPREEPAPLYLGVGVQAARLRQANGWGRSAALCSTCGQAAALRVLWVCLEPSEFQGWNAASTPGTATWPVCWA